MPRNNPEYQKNYIRQHYLNNKDYYKNKAKANDAIRLERNKKFVRRYKLYKGCQHCGYRTHPAALQFHHLRDKDKAIATMMKSHSLQRIKDEIRKCIVLCANCHSIEHSS
jgi:hypothetical protein